MREIQITQILIVSITISYIFCTLVFDFQYLKNSFVARFARIISQIVTFVGENSIKTTLNNYPTNINQITIHKNALTSKHFVSLIALTFIPMLFTEERRINITLTAHLVVVSSICVLLSANALLPYMHPIHRVYICRRRGLISIYYKTSRTLY